MQWLLDNWVVVLLGGGMIAMHLFGHGHGGHGGGKGGGHGSGGHGCCGPKKTADETAAKSAASADDPEHPEGHRHG